MFSLVFFFFSICCVDTTGSCARSILQLHPQLLRVFPFRSLDYRLILLTGDSILC